MISADTPPNNNSTLKKGPSSTRSITSETAAASPSDTETNGSIVNVKNINEIAKKVSVGWSGGLILKNSSFPCRFYLTDGDLDGVDSLLRDEEGKCSLRITQRLRLDQVMSHY